MDAEESIEEIPQSCPSTGLHSDAKVKGSEEEHDGEGKEDLDEPPNESEEKKVVPERVQLLRDIISHTRHFISMVKCPRWQILSLDIVSRCVLLMRMER